MPALVTLPPALPSCTDQVTPWLELLLTVAAKVRLAPAAIDAFEGVTETATGGGAVTVTVARATFVVSTWLVATTWYVPAVVGAVYAPALVTVPPAAPSWTDQSTAWYEVLATAAVNEVVPPAVTVAADGFTLTEMIGAGAATATVATALLVVSTWLVATT